MGRRDYGPIPWGTFDLDAHLDLDAGQRGLLFSLMAVCCYRGQFHRAPRRLNRHIAWPEPIDYLEGRLQALEKAGVISSWVGETVDGQRVHVGQIVGYWSLEGLPRERRNKAPETPEFPEASQSLPGDFPGASRALPTEVAGAHPALPYTPIPARFPEASRPLPPVESSGVEQREEKPARTPARTHTREDESRDIGGSLESAPLQVSDETGEEQEPDRYPDMPHKGIPWGDLTPEQQEEQIVYFEARDEAAKKAAADARRGRGQSWNL